MMVLWKLIMVLELSRADLGRLDAEAARLARGAAALRLAIGRGLLELARRGGHHELGFSSIEAYVLERVERSKTWTRESLALAKKLEALPQVRAAVESGRIGWSMAKVVAKVASPGEEEACLLLAERSTVRELQRLGRAKGAESEAEDDDNNEKGRERFTTLSITMNREDLALFECARLVVKRVSGWESLHLVMEALVDEATSSLEVPSGQRCTPLLEETAGDAQRAWVAQRAQWREESEIRCEPRVRKQPVVPAMEPERVEFAGESFEAIDAKLRALAHELATRDVTIGRLLNRFYAADGWRRLGYATSAQYVRERLGACETSIKEKRKLARRMESMPTLAKAAGDGELGYEAALLVCAVATRETEKEWTERAKRRTLKMLREEISAAGMLARWFDMPQLPPSEETMRVIEEMESRVLSGEAFEDGAAAGAELWDPPAPARGQKSAGRVTLKIRVSADLVRHYRWLEENYLRFRTTRQSFIGFLCTTMIETWKPTLKQTTAWGEIFARDRYRCRCPVCGGTLLNPHHLKARGLGGSDDPSNVAGVCLWCHIYGIHEGRLRALPPANNITWYIGRKPHTVVVGRERMRVA